MHVVVNHLRLREPLSEETVAAFHDGVKLVTEAGGLSGKVVQVDERHVILVLEFASAEDADRIARDVGGPWMREHISPLLADVTDRNLGEVIASSEGL